MKNKLLMSNYNPETKVSQAVIKNKEGIFLGVAYCHPDDTPSTMAGCRYAEARAHLKCVEAKMDKINMQIKGLKDLENIYKDKKSCSLDSPEARTLRKQIYILEKDKSELKIKHENMKKALRKAMDDRDNLLVKMNKKGE